MILFMIRASNFIFLSCYQIQILISNILWLFDVSFVVELKMQNALESFLEKQEIIRMDGSTKRSERNKLPKVTVDIFCKGIGFLQFIYITR